MLAWPCSNSLSKLIWYQHMYVVAQGHAFFLLCNASASSLALERRLTRLHVLCCCIQVCRFMHICGGKCMSSAVTVPHHTAWSTGVGVLLIVLDLKLVSSEH